MNELLSKVMRSFLKDVNPDALHYVPLKGGGSKANLYRFDWDGRSFVLRLFPPQAQPPMRQHQIDLAKLADKIGVGPKVYFVDPQLDGLITEFIHGTTVQPADFEDPDHLAAFATVLQQLHRSTEPFPHACSPFQRFRQFVSKGEQMKIVYPSRFDEVKALMEVLEATFQLSPILVPAHLDLHPLNILLTGKQFTLVDWVNGGLSDPCFDLATFAVFHGLNELQTEAFLTHYFGRLPSQIERNRYIVAQPVRLFVIAAALMALNPSISYAETPELPSISDFVKVEKKWADGQFALPMLKAGLECVDQKAFKRALTEMRA